MSPRFVRTIGAVALTLASFLPLGAYAQAPHTFVFRISGEPETLDWNRAHTPIENYLLTNTMEGLLELDENLKVVPALADKWTQSKDGKTYTFHLRQGVKWSDGVPLRARDFLYSWKRLLTPATAASYAYLLFDIQGAEDFYKGTQKDFSKVGITAPDDSTLIVRLQKPVSYWKYIPTFWVTFPLREDLVQKYGSGWTRPGKMVSVGPYVLKSHVIDSSLTFEANPNYYGKRGNVQAFVAQIVKDDSTALTLYESGKLDFMTDIPSLDLLRLKGRPDLHIYPYLKTGYLGLTVSVKPTDNVHLRRAIAMAIDKSKFAELLHGGQKPATSFIPPQLLGYEKKIGLPYDPARAKAELKASGLSGSVTVGMVIPNWDRPVLLSQFIQQELKKNLGIEVTVQPYDHKTFRSQLDLHRYASFILSWGADYPDPDNFMSMWLSDSGNNRTAFKDPQYDELIARGRVAQSAKAREKLYTQAQKLLLEQEAAVVPLYYDTNMALVKPRVKNFKLSPINYFSIKKVNLGS
jgi:oligopeptide transport system substrate-binding protein